jgi:hypothetical protein
MRCEFGHHDAVYVLGALSPGERLVFERHLSTCPECEGAVRELAGIPGLLGKVEPSVLERDPDDDAPPAQMLPELFQQVRRTRRRRTLATGGLAVLAAGASLVLLAQVTMGDDGPEDVVQTPAPEVPSVEPEQMVPMGEVAVEATLRMEPVLWGTRLGLTCLYDPASADEPLPPTVDYRLYVRTEDGHAERVGSWRAVGGKTMSLSAATASTREEIETVEVRSPAGRVLLRLPS